MKYSKGSLSRVFVIKIEHGDDLLSGITAIAKEEKIMHGVFFMIGALGEGKAVVGPRETVLPPDPQWVAFSDGREIMGIGTLFWKENEPGLHIHAGIGRGSDNITGCIREKAQAYIVVEVILMEIAGVDVKRMPDAFTGMHLIDFSPKMEA